MAGYALYKNPVSPETLSIVQYLYSQGHADCLPSICVERGWPEWATELPCILDLDTSTKWVGLQACAVYFEQRYSLEPLTLLEQALEFKQQNPDFRIGAQDPWQAKVN